MLNPFTTLWGAPDAQAPAPLVLPDDAPTVVAPGPDPDKVLLLGSGPAAGVGVTTHHEALTGALARQLAEHSRRGAIVAAIGRPGLRLDQVPQLLSDAHVERFDAVVLTAGLMEALSRTPEKAWTRTLMTVLDTVHAQQPRDATLILTGMPAPTSTNSMQGRRGRAANRCATNLNNISQSIIETRPYGHFARLAPAPHADGRPTGDCYTSWASQICVVLEPLLSHTQDPAEASTTDDP